jgi:hypothetical protein
VPCWLLQRLSAGLQGQGSSQQVVEDGMGDGGGLWYFPHCYVLFLDVLSHIIIYYTLTDLFLRFTIF